MDIAIIGNQSIKLKGKQATFIVDPAPVLPKTQADAIILLNGADDIDKSRVIESRITIQGAGGYEVSGVKISGTTTPKGILYKLLIDGISVILGRTADAKTEGFSSCEIAIINADDEFNESFVTAMEPKITVIYGTSKIEAAKTLGVDIVNLVPKITISKDKLPEKMEAVVLG